MKSPRAPITCLGCGKVSAILEHTLCQECMFQETPSHFEPPYTATSCQKCKLLSKGSYHDLKLAVDFRYEEGHFASRKVVRNWLKAQRSPSVAKTPQTTSAAVSAHPTASPTASGTAASQLPGAAATKASKDAFLRSPVGGSLTPGEGPPPRFAMPQLKLPVHSATPTKVTKSTVAATATLSHPLTEDG